MNLHVDWTPLQTVADLIVAESHAADACWGCEAAMPFLRPDAAQGPDGDVPVAPPGVRGDGH